MRPELLDRLATVDRLRDQRHIGLHSDESGDPFADEWMVVHHENPNWRTTAAHDASPRTFAGVFRAKSRETQERLADIA